MRSLLAVLRAGRAVLARQRRGFRTEATGSRGCGTSMFRPLPLCGHGPNGGAVRGKPVWCGKRPSENKENRLGRDVSPHHVLPGNLCLGDGIAKEMRPTGPEQYAFDRHEERGIHCKRRRNPRHDRVFPVGHPGFRFFREMYSLGRELKTPRQINRNGGTLPRRAFAVLLSGFPLPLPITVGGAFFRRPGRTAAKSNQRAAGSRR